MCFLERVEGERDCRVGESVELSRRVWTTVLTVMSEPEEEEDSRWGLG